MRPLRDQVLVRLDPPSEFTGGGLLIPEKQRKPSSFGTVVEVGSGRITKTGIAPLEVRIGDRVIVAVGAGTPLEGQWHLNYHWADGSKHTQVILHERLILAVIEEE